MSDLIREDFEKWYVDKWYEWRLHQGYDPVSKQEMLQNIVLMRCEEKYENGKDYLNHAWEGWQAAIASMQGEAPKGFALVPIVTTRAMDDVMREPDWQWIDVLAAAESISEDDYFEPYPPRAAEKIAEQDARIKELEQQLEVARKDEEWKPIQTAPKDGTLLMVYSRTHGYVSAWWGQVDGGGHPENGPPVYWWVSDHCEFIDGPYDAPLMWKPLNELSDTVIAAILQIGGAE